MRKITWLTGDYADVNNRQDQAAERGCAVTIDFHFNGNGPDAKGGEVWYKPADAKAKALGQAILDTFSSLGLPFHGDEPLKEAVPPNRASFIRHYRNPAILIEPLFVSNPGANQAGWIHQKGNVQALAQKIAEALEAATTDKNSLIGLSIGHIYKPSKHDDTGVDCVRGDTEADHARAVAEAVGSILTGASVTAPPWPPDRLKPISTTIETEGDSALLVDNPVLKSDGRSKKKAIQTAAAAAPDASSYMLRSALLANDPTLRQIAETSLVLVEPEHPKPVAGIEAVQEALNRLATAGMALPRINFRADDKFRGWFGPQTVDALRAFQRSEGIGVDAKIGDETLRALDNALVSRGVGGLMPGAPAGQPKPSRAAATKPAAIAQTSAGKFVKTLAKVFNRGNDGIPPLGFLQELVAWGKTAPDEIFVDKQTKEKDVYASATEELGPFGDITHRKACMLEVMRVLAGFESSWNWNEGRDKGNVKEDSPDTISAGAFQVSANSMAFGQDLRDLVAPHGISNQKRDGNAFQALMKANHPVAMEYIARLMRYTRRANGPLLKGNERSKFNPPELRLEEQSIYPWLSRDAVAEFQAFLTPVRLVRPRTERTSRRSGGSSGVSAKKRSRTGTSKRRSKPQ